MHACPSFGRLIYIVTALLIAAGIFGCATTQGNAPTSMSAQTGVQAEKTVVPGQVQRPVPQGPFAVTYYPPPGRIDFCGESVPLENQEVLERFDKEFTILVYNHAQVYRLLKRKERYFSSIEERLRRLNLPEDLKYVAIAEIEPPQNTPRRSVDIRYDFEFSPDGALQYLGSLYGNFKSWSLAVTAYSAGEKRIIDQCRAQGERDCYQMMLPQDTERYLFRILAIKAILTDPARYGYEPPRGTGNR